ncbi:LacI family DNA-binding transcriptional regulator [Coraliomargarita algicola]|uniref:LacI family DNA-binding transcriptional regulator n=1 Tax=Coraliomargarita algicola TaxID=3092156 RepID=A0ABZ0RQ64_9BACT|nr:LacI family DNA-binding transcriptional regulator [Coraliomargarita sp. J2-16]WPJ97253.1 LacI family DNA-binding transcriptional regulator [Coraliomargarita sp. J2-16]
MQNTPNKRPTIYDVAKLAGVSHATVSRVVRGADIVKPTTIEIVKAAIEKLGYRPDPALSALAAYRSNMQPHQGHGETLAFIDCDGSEYSEIVYAGSLKEASSLGYQVEKYELSEQTREQHQLARQLYHRGVRGLIFGPSNQERELSGWNWDEHAALTLGTLMHSPRLHAVAADYFFGAYSACHLLRGRGCQRIGLAIDPSLEARTSHRWLGGYCAAMDGLNQNIYRKPWPPAKHFRTWCRRKKIDGIVTIHGELREYWEENFGNFLMISSLDNQVNKEGQHYVLEPSGLGEEAIRMIHHLLLKREYGLPTKPRIVMIPGTWTGINEIPNSN